MWAGPFCGLGPKLRNKTRGISFCFLTADAIRSYHNLLPPGLLCQHGLNSQPVSTQTFPSLISYYQVFCWSKKSSWDRQYTFLPSIWLSNVNVTKIEDKSMSQNVYRLKIILWIQISISQNICSCFIAERRDRTI